MTELTPYRLKQNRGPTVRFHGEVLIEDEWEIRSGDLMQVAVYRTAAGALIAHSRVERADGAGIPDSRVSIVELDEDEVSMRCAVMDHFAWDNKVRTLLKRQLGWTFEVEVD